MSDASNMVFEHPDIISLPIFSVLDPLCEAFEFSNRAILSAPPGAGKTTTVPLALLARGWRKGNRIILVEPRRLAARAAANRMATLLGEQTGETVGYRMRLDNRVSDQTIIEVVTEGVFTRMIVEDPELAGVAAVIFDEFHERSLDADFGLALALDAQAGLREDLRILVMSATLDVEKLSHSLDQPPLIESQGRSFPVDLRYEPRRAGERVEEAMLRNIKDAHERETGSILAFLPGQGEIRRLAEALDGKFPADTIITPLYGNLTKTEQDQAIQPAPAGTRKIVLATSIAETSITIEGVRIVIDSGLQRLPQYEPATGMSRLETVKASRASADQRAGRAGRTEPGIAIRLWHSGQNAALPAHAPPQILSSDLTGLVLDMASWGVQDPGQLNFVDQPPASLIAEAKALLKTMGALDENDRILPKGAKMRALGLPPRLAAMVVAAEERHEEVEAAEIAVLIGEQGLGGNSADLDERLHRFRNDRSPRANAARSLVRKLSSGKGGRNTGSTSHHAGHFLIDAYPDRIAINRGGKGRYVMANGRGAEIETESPLARHPMLVIVDATGRAGKARILSAAAIDQTDVETRLKNAIITSDQCFFDAASGQVRARRVTRLGAVALEERALPKPSGESAARALADGIITKGLSCVSFGKELEQLRARISFLHRTIGGDWPDVSDNALLASMEAWFVPYQSGVTALADIKTGELHNGIMSLLPYDLHRELDRLAPKHFETPAGQRHSIRYDGEEPVLAVRVQELFGLKSHPVIAGRWPLLFELTSPAGRPIQMTKDIVGFWSGSWKDVRAEMRGRYPKHPWPEDPANAEPTHRAKPRS